MLYVRKKVLFLNNGLESEWKKNELEFSNRVVGPGGHNALKCNRTSQKFKNGIEFLTINQIN